MVFSTKRVFYKQRDNNFFPSMSYDAGLLLTQIPQSTIEAVIFSAITYWMCGFEPSGKLQQSSLAACHRHRTLAAMSPSRAQSFEPSGLP